MTNVVRDHVAKLSDERRRAIMADHDTLERTCSVGKCAMREEATTLLRSMNIKDDYRIVLWMNQLANECYRYYAMLYMEGVKT